MVKGSNLHPVVFGPRTCKGCKCVYQPKVNDNKSVLCRKCHNKHRKELERIRRQRATERARKDPERLKRDQARALAAMKAAMKRVLGYKFKILYPVICSWCENIFDSPYRNAQRCYTCRVLRNAKSGDIQSRCKQFGLAYDSSVTTQRVGDRDGWVCQHPDCGQVVPKIGEVSKNDRLSPTIDHILCISSPWSTGHIWPNVRLMHRGCNSRRRDRPTKAEVTSTDYELCTQQLLLLALTGVLEKKHLFRYMPENPENFEVMRMHKRPPILERKCKECGKEFKTTWDRQQFCKKRCQRRERHRRENEQRKQQRQSKVENVSCRYCSKLTHRRVYCSDYCRNRDKKGRQLAREIAQRKYNRSEKGRLAVNRAKEKYRSNNV